MLLQSDSKGCGFFGSRRIAHRSARERDGTPPMTNAKQRGRCGKVRHVRNGRWKLLCMPAATVAMADSGGRQA